MKQKLKKWLYVFTLWGIKGALLLCMSVSCKKTEPELLSGYHPELDCDDGTCCSTLVGVKYEFVTEFKDKLFGIKQSDDGIPSIFGTTDLLIDGKGIGGFVCDIGADKIKGLNNNVPPPFSASPTLYKYRISGKLYLQDAMIFCMSCALPYTIRIEKAEIIP